MIRRRGDGRILWFFVYALFGVYLLNVALNFIKIPASFAPVSKWIIFIGGGLLIFSAIRFLVRRRYVYG
jgi:hypothetical protein